MMFLLTARRYGRTKAKTMAEAYGWKCEAAIAAIDRMSA
jgi:hypothetical protein